MSGVSASDADTTADVFKPVSPSDTLSDQAILGTMLDICYMHKNNTYYTAMHIGKEVKVNSSPGHKGNDTKAVLIFDLVALNETTKL